MILLDTALAEREARGLPIRVAMIGAGFMGRGVTRQIIHSTPGMTLVAICNRSIENAERAFREAGVEEMLTCSSVSELEGAIERGVAGITDDPKVVSRCDSVDVVFEVTGAVEFGAKVALDAIEHAKHIVVMNPELEATVGFALSARAERAGVIFSGVDGDQPGVQLNLYRFVRQIGLTPLVCGNIKGFEDRHRNPETQAGFASQWGQNPRMVTSFCDGTKIAFEQVTVANATGLSVPARLGRQFDGHVDELVHAYDVEALQEAGGIVDYVVGAKPSPGVFVLATHDDPLQRRYLELYKLGRGPLYPFYTPQHLCHFEAPMSIARAALFGDTTIAPAVRAGEVVAMAKVDLREGDELDGIGGFKAYGVAEAWEAARRKRCLPMGLSEGCRVVHPVSRDDPITLDDVVLPSGRVCDDLWRETAEIEASPA